MLRESGKRMIDATATAMMARVIAAAAPVAQIADTVTASGTEIEIATCIAGETAP